MANAGKNYLPDTGSTKGKAVKPKAAINSGKKFKAPGTAPTGAHPPVSKGKK